MQIFYALKIVRCCDMIIFGLTFVKRVCKMNNNPIGFLDSGIGGVTVLREAVKLLPNENYFFFSDSAHNPYGDKTDEEIIKRCDEIVGLMIEKNCKAVVLACNTASAKAVGFLRKKYSFPIVAIEPAYKMVHDFNPNGATLVMATKGTIESEKFHKLFYKYYNENTALMPCVGLADIIEKGDKAEIEDYLNKNFAEYVGLIDNVVLGCTHYPLIKDEIRAVLGDVKFFDGAVGVSKQLKKVLSENDLLSSSQALGNIEFVDSSADEKVRYAKQNRFFELL